jgi:acyl carrier protein
LHSEIVGEESGLESSKNHALKTQIIAAICEVKEQPELALSLKGSTNLLEETAIDSLQMTNLILLIEETCSVSVDFASLRREHFNSLDAFTDFVAGLPKA